MIAKANETRGALTVFFEFLHLMIVFMPKLFLLYSSAAYRFLAFTPESDRGRRAAEHVEGDNRQKKRLFSSNLHMLHL
jgi:hypothetical protein